MIIKEVLARAIKDSRGQDTIEILINGSIASSPSGKSTGKYETPCYHKSLDWNIKAINNFKSIIGLEINSFDDLKKLELLIKKKFKLKDAKQFGANALFALECSILKALAKSEGLELWQLINKDAKKIPTPVGNAIGGGLHSHAENHPLFQEFLLIPNGTTFEEKYSTMRSVHQALALVLNSSVVNDEGAWECSISEEEILNHLKRFSDLTDLGIDVASSSFFKKSSYKYKDKTLSQKEQIDYMNLLIKKYNLLYVEDPMNEEDFSGFNKISKKAWVVGDDLTVTHPDRLNRAIKNKSLNAMIVKPNQNGSLLEVKKVIDICKKHKIKTILSHRSGETLDNALADLAFGFQTDYIKCGIATQWRESKLNRLLEIEQSLQ